MGWEDVSMHRCFRCEGRGHTFPPSGPVQLCELCEGRGTITCAADSEIRNALRGAADLREFESLLWQLSMRPVRPGSDFGTGERVGSNRTLAAVAGALVTVLGRPGTMKRAA